MSPLDTAIYAAAFVAALDREVASLGDISNKAPGYQTMAMTGCARRAKHMANRIVGLHRDAIAKVEH